MGKLLLLPALALAVASALQLEHQEQPDKPNSHERRARPSHTTEQLKQLGEVAPEKPQRTVLLVVAGLTRHFSVTWPRIVQSLLQPNEAEGYTFKIVFSTETGLECVPGSDTWKSRKCETNSDPDVHRQHIKEVFAPRHVKVLDHNHLCLAPGAPGARQARTGSMLVEDQSMPSQVGAEMANITDDKFSPMALCAPWWERVHRVVEEVVQSGETFDRVVALRPDILIKWAYGTEVAGDKTKPPELLLDRMCEQKPGLNFVTPSWEIQHRSWLHNRDLDFVHILCPGDKLPLYEEAIRSISDKCHFHKGYKTPRVPPGFKSTKGWNDFAFMCHFVQVFNESDIPMAHWDDSYTCEWPNLGAV